jgi:hypothetical protein
LDWGFFYWGFFWIRALISILETIFMFGEEECNKINRALFIWRVFSACGYTKFVPCCFALSIQTGMLGLTHKLNQNDHIFSLDLIIS